MLVNVLVVLNPSQVASIVQLPRDVCNVKRVGTLKAVSAINVLM
jgi:hypothetical protein